MSIKLIGLADTWKVCLVEHVNYEIAHGNHVISSAGWSEIELVQACVHDISTEFFNIFLVDMLTRFLIYDASGEPEVD